MSDYPKALPVPQALLYYRSTIRVVCAAGKEKSGYTSAVGSEIPLPPGLPCKPLVKVQAYAADKTKCGPCWCFDWEADNKRGVWVTYDPDLHEVPGHTIESESLPDADPSDHVAHLEPLADKSESTAYAPYADTPDCDDSDRDEPSDDHIDADEDPDEDNDGAEIAG